MVVCKLGETSKSTLAVAGAPLGAPSVGICAVFTGRSPDHVFARVQVQVSYDFNRAVRTTNIRFFRRLVDEVNQANHEDLRLI